MLIENKKAKLYACYLASEKQTAKEIAKKRVLLSSKL